MIASGLEHSKNNVGIDSDGLSRIIYGKSGAIGQTNLCPKCCPLQIRPFNTCSSDLLGTAAEVCSRLSSGRSSVNAS